MADRHLQPCAGTDAGCPRDGGVYCKSVGSIGGRQHRASASGRKSSCRGVRRNRRNLHGACANCHNDRNDVGPSKAISLSLSSAVRESGRQTPSASSCKASSRSPDRPAPICRRSRHVQRRGDRLARAICPCTLHQPAAMDRHSPGNLESETGRELKT